MNISMINDIDVKQAEIVGQPLPSAPVANLANLSDDEFEKEAARRAALKKTGKELRKQNLEALKTLNAEYISKYITRLVRHQETSAGFIDNLFKDFSAQLALKQELYGVDVSNQDSHTVTLPDGTASITIGYNVIIGFDGTESAGVQKIKDFITSLSGEGENIKKLTRIVNTLLKPNIKTGMLRPNKIVELNALRTDFQNDQFDEAMDIILNAQNRVRTTTYVSGWQIIDAGDNRTKKIEFRFTV